MQSPAPPQPTSGLDAGAAVPERCGWVHGQPLAHIYPTGRMGVAPATVCAGRSGLFAALHFPGLVKPGDRVAVVAVPLPA